MGLLSSPMMIGRIETQVLDNKDQRPSTASLFSRNPSKQTPEPNGSKPWALQVWVFTHVATHIVKGWLTIKNLPFGVDDMAKLSFQGCIRGLGERQSKTQQRQLPKTDVWQKLGERQLTPSNITYFESIPWQQAIEDAAKLSVNRLTKPTAAPQERPFGSLPVANNIYIDICTRVTRGIRVYFECWKQKPMPSESSLLSHR